MLVPLFGDTYTGIYQLEVLKSFWNGMQNTLKIRIADRFCDVRDVLPHFDVISSISRS